jgi:hypothetical protein
MHFDDYGSEIEKKKWIKGRIMEFFQLEKGGGMYHQVWFQNWEAR